MGGATEEEKPYSYTESQFELTKEFMEGLQRSGADLVTVHARTRGSSKKRRCGPADLEMVEALAQ